MKNSTTSFLIFVLLSGLFIACSNDPIGEIKEPINPEIDSLNKAFVGTWDLHDFVTPHESQILENQYLVLGNMPDYISYSDACQILIENSIPITLSRSYIITYRDNVLHADKISTCDENDVQHMTWEIVLQKFSSTVSPIQYTEHQFKILEKDSSGILTRTYDVIQFNLDKESLRQYNVPTYSFQVNSDYDTYNSYVPYPSVGSIRYNRK